MLLLVFFLFLFCSFSFAFFIPLHVSFYFTLNILASLSTNSALFFVLITSFIKSSVTSACCIVDKAFLTCKYIVANSCFVSNKSSLRVPDLLILIAGNIRFLRQCFYLSATSIFPVPLNSSNITSSILLPVSTKAVANIVRLPPFSIFLAAPKNFFGL